LESTEQLKTSQKPVISAVNIGAVMKYHRSSSFPSRLFVQRSIFIFLAASLLFLGSTDARPTAGDFNPDSLSEATEVQSSRLNSFHQTQTEPVSPIYLPVIRKDRGGLAVDISNRQAVIDFYHQHYLAYENTSLGWTGNHATCDPGTNSLEARDAVIHRVNYYRAMAGVPADITRSDAFDEMAQAAALILSVNDALSHYPDETWTCYSQAAYDGASRSNISIGNYGWFAVMSQFRDAGDNNYGVGHRRWILYPQLQVMGSGSIPSVSGYRSSNALYVVDSKYVYTERPPTRHPYVAWPPSGYVPYQVVYARWSFSFPNADFSDASVTMTSAGETVPVTMEAVRNSPGDNTLVWRPYGMGDRTAWPKPAVDQVMNVTVSTVIIDGLPHKFSYAVTIINP
jgi:hypothetical protein